MPSIRTEGLAGAHSITFLPDPCFSIIVPTVFFFHSHPPRSSRVVQQKKNAAEKNAVASGKKKVYYEKKSDKRKAELRSQFEELYSKGKLGACAVCLCMYVHACLVLCLNA